MTVATWGPGTGATGTGSHPFCLRVQGVCYIGSVPMESISVSASMSGNATLTFTIVDTTGALPVPAAWADVELADRTEGEWIFGGLVMGVEVSQGTPGVRVMAVRCVDYGVLLDVAPLMADLTVPGDIGSEFHSIIQLIAGAVPLGGMMALAYSTGGVGRVAKNIDEGTPGQFYSVFIPVGSDETLSSGQMARAALDSYARRAEDPYAITAHPAALYLTPLRQVAVLPAGKTFGTAPLQVRQNPTTSSHVAAEDVSYDIDGRSIEAVVYVTDSDTTTGGDNSGYVNGTINGYTVMPGSLTSPLWDDAQRATEAALYTAARVETVAGEAVVTCAKNFMPGQALTVYYPDIDLDDTYVITAVQTRFLGGPGLLRRSTIQFNGERGTVARFNRTRFARAGVTT